MTSGRGSGEDWSRRRGGRDGRPGQQGGRGPGRGQRRPGEPGRPGTTARPGSHGTTLPSHPPARDARRPPRSPAGESLGAAKSPAGAPRSAARPPGGASRGAARPSAGPTRGPARGSARRRAAARPRADGVPPRKPRQRRLRRTSSIRRLNATLIAVAFAISLIVGRLIQLQGVAGSHYRALSEKQQRGPHADPRRPR